MTEQIVLLYVLFMIVVSLMIGGKVLDQKKIKTQLIQILHRISWLDSFTLKHISWGGGCKNRSRTLTEQTRTLRL